MIYNENTNLLGFFDGSNLLNAGHEVIKSITVAFSGGETKSNLELSGAGAGDDISVKWYIDSDPGNDAGLQLNKIWWDSSDGVHRAEMTETENAGGGTFVIKAVREA